MGNEGSRPKGSPVVNFPYRFQDVELEYVDKRYRFAPNEAVRDMKGETYSIWDIIFFEEHMQVRFFISTRYIIGVNFPIHVTVGNENPKLTPFIIAPHTLSLKDLFPDLFAPQSNNGNGNGIVQAYSRVTQYDEYNYMIDSPIKMSSIQHMDLVKGFVGEYASLRENAIPQKSYALSITPMPLVFTYVKYGIYICKHTQTPCITETSPYSRKDRIEWSPFKLIIFPTMYIVICVDYTFQYSSFYLVYPLSKSDSESLFSGGDFTISSTDLMPVTDKTYVYSGFVMYDVPPRPLNPQSLPNNEFFTQKILFQSDPSPHLALLRQLSMHGVEYRTGHTQSNYEWLFSSSSKSNPPDGHHVLIEGASKFIPPVGVTALSIHDGRKKTTNRCAPARCGTLIELSGTTLSEALPHFQTRISWKTLLTRLPQAKFACNARADLSKPISL